MELKLYHYVHCQYCIRVRLALGYLGYEYSSIIVPYDDEKTPVSLAGVKMLPILVIDKNAMNESLDIISVIDKNHYFQIEKITSTPGFKHFDDYLNKLGANIHNLTMPYWIYTPEFNEKSREYFQRKKEVKRGPFKLLVKNRAEFESALMKDLIELSEKIHPFYLEDQFSLYDILLASHLWGLYIVPEFQFPEKIHQYLQKVKKICHFNYHEDFWK
jgi:glutaredoxin 2